MGVKLSLEGFNELRAALQSLPEDLANEARDIVSQTAQDARSEIQNGYPIRTTNLHPGPKRKSKWFPPGNLKSRVTVLNNAGNRATTKSIVKSNAPHSWLFNEGWTKGYNRSNSKGANRGRMPKPTPDKAMIPKVIRLRARMVNQLVELVRRAGFEVNV